MDPQQTLKSAKKTSRNAAKWLAGRLPGVTENIVATVIITILGSILVLSLGYITPILSWLKRFLSQHILPSSLALIIILLIFAVGIIMINKRRRQNLPWPLDETRDTDFDAFLTDVRLAFEAKGFTLENESGNGFDLTGISRIPSLPQRAAVMIERNTNMVLTRRGVKAIMYFLRHYKIDRCYYISRSPRSFFREDQIVAACDDHVEFITYQDFVLMGIKFESYLRHLVSSWENSRASKMYIEVSGKDENGKIHKPLDAFLDELLYPLGKEMNVVLLGDFGTGKTTCLKHYAYILAHRCLANQVINPIPILINLKDFELVDNLEQLVSRELSQLGVTTPFNLIADVQLRRKIVLVLDAFDEMTLHVDRVSVQRNLRRIEDMVSQYPGAFIISCRKHFFRDSIEEGLFRNFLLLSLMPWGKTELIDYLQKATGNKWKGSLKRIKETHHLEELAQTPLFLDMIVASLEDFPRRKVLSAELYTAYTNKWINSQIYKAVLDRDQKAEFMEELAWKMIIEGRRFIPWPELRNLIQIHYKLPVSDIDRFDNDIRTCSFLSRSTENTGYIFSHNSFLEFFVAKYLSKSVKNDNIEPLCKVELPYEVNSFLAQLLDKLTYYERLHLWFMTGNFDPRYALARRNAIQILKIMSRSPVNIMTKQDRLEKIEEQIELVMSGRDLNTRWRAVITLGWLRPSDRTIKTLQQLLSNQENDSELLQIAVVVIGLLGAISAIPILTKLLREAQIDLLRQKCTVALGLLGDTSVIHDLVYSTQHDEQFLVRRAAIWAIEILDPVMARSTLTDRALNDSNEEVRQYAALALGRLGGDEALNTLELALSDSSPLVRRSALDAIGNIGGSRALRLAESLLNDSDAGVKEASKHAVNRIKLH